MCVCATKFRTGIRLYTVYNVETFVAKATEKLLYQALTLLQQVGEKPPTKNNAQSASLPNTNGIINCIIYALSGAA